MRDTARYSMCTLYADAGIDARRLSLSCITLHEILDSVA